MVNDQQFCTFYLDGHCFGVEVEKVQEVLRYQKMTGVPTAPETVQGLINLRGQIVMAVDLRRCLEFSDRGDDAYPMNVVIRADGDVVSLLVDEIGDVLEVGETSFEESPSTLNGVARDLVRGVHKLEDTLLLVLDTDKTINTLSGNGVMHSNVN